MIWFFVRGNEHHGRRVHAFDTTPQLARFSAFPPRALTLEGWRLSPIWSAAGAQERS